MHPDDHVCMCYRVSLRKIRAYMKQENPVAASGLSECLGAGTGCGWCVPFLEELHRQHRAGEPAPDVPGVDPATYAALRTEYRRTGRREQEDQARNPPARGVDSAQQSSVAQNKDLSPSSAPATAQELVGRASVPPRPESPPSSGQGASDIDRGKLETCEPRDGFRAHRRRLPHWTIDGATYFLTWRLGAGQGPMSPGERSAVLEALRHFDAERYDLAAFVVMDDHVHVVVRPYEGYGMSSLAHSWKSYTAHRMQREFGRVGAIWQSETFDRIIRNEQEYFDIIKYIMLNPRRRWPGAEKYQWAGVAGGPGCQPREEEQS